MNTVKYCVVETIDAWMSTPAFDPDGRVVVGFCDTTDAFIFCCRIFSDYFGVFFVMESTHQECDDLQTVKAYLCSDGPREFSFRLAANT